jgi:propionate CoA-transferase
MNPFIKIKLIAHVLRWRFTWSKKDLDYLPPVSGLSPKFITARAAARLIPDGATAFSCGFAGTARCSVFFWAIREAFEKDGHPRDLTWINVGAQGGRGKVPGTIEELGLPGLMRRYITGHLETTKAQLRLAEAGQLELHVLPQGVMTQLIAGQGAGRSGYSTTVGVGTRMDPRVGQGSPVLPDTATQFVEAEGDQLVYTMPPLQYVFLNAPYADAEGNIYFHHAASINENYPAVEAARANGGRVFVTVTSLIPKDEATISLPADQVDHIVVHPYNEQTASVRQRRFWPVFTPGARFDVKKEAAKLKYINNFLKITPRRSAVDDVMASMAADLLLEVTPEGAMANIGVGYPEEVARHVVERGNTKALHFTTEAGAYGGLPVPGIFFGAALGPEKLISSSEMFRLYQDQLGLAVLGFLQVDELGNVNAGKRGATVREYVGPGGFPDIANGAKIILFVGSWQAGAEYALQNGRIKVVKNGAPKFIKRVDEITFNAAEALKMGKQVFYVTHAGIFKLAPEGLKIWKPAPGIDIQRDILDACPANILPYPPSNPTETP